MKNEREITKVNLGNDPLPWVTHGKHLGNNLENVINGLRRAQYVDKNCEINQEFYFAHPETRFKLNRIYNGHFTGSPLWDLFCKESVMLENSYNVSFRATYDLPRSTHRYFVEAVTNQKHVKSVLIQRFLSFIDQIQSCPKDIVRHLLSIIKYDVGSVTGSNLRNIMQLLNKDTVHELKPSDANFMSYKEVPVGELWRIDMLKELIEERNHQVEIEGFTTEELDDMINFICTS